MMHAVAAVYCGFIIAAALFGGMIPHLFQLTHTRMQVALSFVAGLMLGIGLLHLIPHANSELKNVDFAMRWALGGFLVMFFMERFFPFHHHDPPQETADDDPHHVDHAHDHDHAHHEHHAHSATGPRVSWGGAFLGLTLHSLVDGVALAAAVTADWQSGHDSLIAGLGTFLAIVLHKPFDSMTIGTLMRAGGWSRGWRHAINLAYALMAPLGVTLFFVLGPDAGGAMRPALLGGALAFAGGAFLCIATADLLPELQFHSHDRFKLSLWLLLGIGLAMALVLVESSGHGHG